MLLKGLNLLMITNHFVEIAVKDINKREKQKQGEQMEQKYKLFLFLCLMHIL